MDSDLQPYQLVRVVKERGTREKAFVRGITRNNQIVVVYEDGKYDIVDREDIET